MGLENFALNAFSVAGVAVGLGTTLRTTVLAWGKLLKEFEVD